MYHQAWQKRCPPLQSLLGAQRKVNPGWFLAAGLHLSPVQIQGLYSDFVTRRVNLPPGGLL